MDAYRHIAASVPAAVVLPVGTLTETPGRGVRISMPHTARTRGLVRTILERLDGAAAEWLWVPTVVDEAGDELVLDYELEASESQAFPAALPRFIKTPEVYLPELIGLARYLAAASHALDRVQVPSLIAPACLRYTPSREGAWRLMVVPLIDVSLADWAGAAPPAWEWTPAA